MTVFTIGYAGRKLGDFLALLQEHNVAIVVDVRRFPKSKACEYSKESLEAELRQARISYIWMGDTLGGFRSGGYRNYMESDSYKEGVDKLLELAKRKRLVLLCKERNDAGCHRRYIAQSLAERGVKTVSLL